MYCKNKFEQLIRSKYGREQSTLCIQEKKMLQNAET